AGAQSRCTRTTKLPFVVVNWARNCSGAGPATFGLWLQEKSSGIKASEAAHNSAFRPVILRLSNWGRSQFQQAGAPTSYTPIAFRTSLVVPGRPFPRAALRRQARHAPAAACG